MSSEADDRARRVAPGVARTALYERVADWLIAYIAERGVAVDDRLPTERSLAERFDVSRASVRQALAALQAQGLIEIRHGDGIYLRRRPEERLAFESLLAKRRRLPEVIEARQALEVALAGLAAQRRTDGDLQRIWLALDLMDADIAAGGIGAEGDKHFHAAVTAAAGNALLRELMDYLAGVIHDTRIASLSQPGRPKRSSAQHRRIAEAIEAGDPAAAQTAMRAHIDLVGDLT
ncbi:FadR/GntR family transcriptional regulator [Egicoccus sp. AB-alg6-2]|uniref:FadR/GntR family transcriptional regulator n=1 Tax=Egicoccus sp. AB-alg6-2 TaxID=3242692 RepID=UPI00359DC6FE